MPTTNKFAVLAEVSDKKRQIVITTEGNLPRKAKKGPASPTEGQPAKAAAPAAKPAAKAAAPAAKKAAAPKAQQGPVSDAPTDLRAAAAFNKKKAEERAAKLAAEAEAKAVADRAAAEAAAVKQASEEIQAEVQADADAAKEAADEAATAAESRKKPEPTEPVKQVKTLADYQREREESKFAIGAKQARKVDASAVTGLQKLEHAQGEFKIEKKAPAPVAKPAAKPAAKGAKAAAAAAPAPKLEKKEKAAKLDLNQFADFTASQERGRGRGFGGFRGGERGGERGGYRGGHHGGRAFGGDRQPNYDDARAFPSL